MIMNMNNIFVVTTIIIMTVTMIYEQCLCCDNAICTHGNTTSNKIGQSLPGCKTYLRQRERGRGGRHGLRAMKSKIKERQKTIGLAP